MLPLIIALLLALVAAPAVGAPAARPRVPLPPVQYDRPYHGNLRVIIRTWGEINRLCTGGRDPYAWACSVVSMGHCTVYVPLADGRRVDRQGHARLLRHEIGHCNGWPQDHRGARY